MVQLAASSGSPILNVADYFTPSHLPSAVNAEVLSTPAFYNNTVYFHGSNDTMKAFRLSGGKFNPTTPVARSAAIFGSPSSPDVSYNSKAGANANSTALLWATERGRQGQAVLHAYTADTLTEVYNSGAQGMRDYAGSTVEFTVPTVAAGKVFVGTASQLVVYGGGFFENWSGESALGGSAQQIAVGRNQDGRLEVFYVGTDNAIYHNWQVAPNSDWAGQAALGGSAKQVTVGQNLDGRLEIFYIGTDTNLYHRPWSFPRSRTR